MQKNNIDVLIFKSNNIYSNYLKLIESHLKQKNMYKTSHWSDNLILYCSKEEKKIYLRITDQNLIIQMPYSNFKKNLKENLYIYINKRELIIEEFLNQNTKFFCLFRESKEKGYIINMAKETKSNFFYDKSEFINDFFVNMFSFKVNILYFLDKFYFTDDLENEYKISILNKKLIFENKREKNILSDCNNYINIDYDNEIYISSYELFKISVLLSNLVDKKKQEFYIALSVFKDYLYINFTEDLNYNNFFYLKRIISKNSKLLKNYEEKYSI